VLTSSRTTSGGTGAEVRLGTVGGAVVAGVVVTGAGLVVVVVVGGKVVVVDVVVLVVLDVVGVGSERLRISCEKPKAACRPAAAPASGGRVGAGSGAVGVAGTAAVRLVLGENAAKAATANRAMTTHVKNARSLVNRTVRIRLLSMISRWNAKSGHRP